MTTLFLLSCNINCHADSWLSVMGAKGDVSEAVSACSPQFKINHQKYQRWHSKSCHLGTSPILPNIYKTTQQKSVGVWDDYLVVVVVPDNSHMSLMIPCELFWSHVPRSLLSLKFYIIRNLFVSLTWIYNTSSCANHSSDSMLTLRLVCWGQYQGNPHGWLCSLVL